MKPMFSLTLALGFMIAATQASARTIESTVKSVESGDMLVLTSGDRVRLFGIDAPELSQQCEREGSCIPCGSDARDALYKWSAGVVRCEAHGKRLGVLIARCFGSGVDLGEQMLGEGQAVTFRNRLRKGEYLPASYGYAEAKAKDEKIGIWAGTMITPWNWRHGGQRLKCEH